MTAMGEELPRECWEHILNKLDHHSHFSSLSLVSTQFLSITNRLFSTLKLSDSSVLSILPRILHRFQNLKTIDLTGFAGDLNPILYRIAVCGLNLESLIISNQTSLPLNGLRMMGSKMRNLKCLDCSKVKLLQDSDLELIAESFPLLEELDIRYPELGSANSSNGFSNSSKTWKPISDSGIYALTLKLKGLRKIDLSGNQFITDMSLMHLSKHCVMLTQVVLHFCDFITHDGVVKLIRSCAQLNCVSARGIGVSFFGSSLSFGSLGCALITSESISAIEFSDSYISDELLYSIAEARVPMKKLVLSNCTGYTFAGISFLVRHYPLLEYLNLEATCFLTDKDMSELALVLRSITYINLSYCYYLTGVTLYVLARNCPVLNEVRMVGTNIGDEVLEKDFVPDIGVKSLDLSHNTSMRNGFIQNYVSLCPNLEVLDVSFCVNITEDGILEALKRCSKIRHLYINSCFMMKNLSEDFELPHLEILCARGLEIGDGSLALIAKKCSRLQKLDLTGCLRVTANGVREVVAKCKEMREISLRSCDRVGADIIPWIVFSRPSLKIIVPPCDFVPTESQRYHFLLHGCHVYDS